VTNEGKRNQSRVEFDNTYFAVDDDIENLITTNFGLKGEKLEKHKDYLKRKTPLLERLSQTLFIHLKVEALSNQVSYMKMEENKVIKDLGTAIMCVNNLLTQEHFIVRDQVVNAMIQAINTIKEQRQQIIMLVGAQHGVAEVIKELQENE